MAKVFLVRHGQASLGKENYDELSTLGHTQSRVLGTYFQNTDISFSHTVTGTLNRHIQTADGISRAMKGLPTPIKDANWNEFDFKTLVNAYLQSSLNTSGNPNDVKGYFIALKNAMLAWQSQDLCPSQMESWLEFETRVMASLEKLSHLDRREKVLVVTSGGAISMALAQVYKLNAAQMIDLNLEIQNTSISTLNFKKDRIALSSFNCIPHIDLVNKPELSTYA